MVGDFGYKIRVYSCIPADPDDDIAAELFVTSPRARRGVLVNGIAAIMSKDAFVERLKGHGFEGLSGLDDLVAKTDGEWFVVQPFDLTTYYRFGNVMSHPGFISELNRSGVSVLVYDGDVLSVEGSVKRLIDLYSSYMVSSPLK